MTGRSYELPDDITTLGGMVIFELINWDIRGARPRGFHIPKLSQVRALTRFYALVPFLPYLNLQVSSVFVFVVLSSQYCNIWNPNPRLTVTERDKTPTLETADALVAVTDPPLACRWRVLRGCSPHCCRAGGAQTVG